MSVVINTAEVRRAREVHAIFIADEVHGYFSESGLPCHPSAIAEPGEMVDFLEYVTRLIDGSWVEEDIEYPVSSLDEARCVDSVYHSVLCCLRACATGEFECIRISDGSFVPAIKIIRRPGDDAYHHEALAKAREFLLKTANVFGLPSLRELAR
jgi:hypothetical protein